MKKKAIATLLLFAVAYLVGSRSTGCEDRGTVHAHLAPPEQRRFAAGLPDRFADRERLKREAAINPLRRDELFANVAGAATGGSPWLFEVVEIGEEREYKHTREADDVAAGIVYLLTGEVMKVTEYVRSFEVELAYAGHEVRVSLSTSSDKNYHDLRAALAAVKPRDWVAYEGEVTVDPDGLWKLWRPLRVTKWSQ